jgi:mono/diheme cytochrome c family protein
MRVKIWLLCAAAVCASWALLATGEATAAKEDRGAEIYSNLCASCHGRYGRGDGPLARELKLKPPDFLSSDWLARRSDDEIIAGLKSGAHPAMSVATVLDEGALRAALQYVRNLAPPGKYLSVLRGRDLYNASCWVCHGRNGDGKGPAAKTLEGPKPRDFTSPDFIIEGRESEIADTISRGAAASFHGSPMMPAWSSSLSPQQIHDLVEYLKTFRKR